MRFDIILRKATQTDSEILSAIHQESFLKYWNTEEFNNFFAVPGTFAVLAEIIPTPTLPPQGGGRSEAGMIVVRGAADEAEIITIAVRPPFRRQGIARALLEDAMKKAGAAGTLRLFLDVEEGNAAALKLYETHGFSMVRRRKQYYRQLDGSYTDALVMSRKLR